MFEVKIASHFKIVYIYFGQNAIYKCWCIPLRFWSKLSAKEELNPSSLKHYSYTFKVWVQLFDQLWYYWSVGISAELKLSVLPPDNIYCSVYSERFPSNKHPHVPGCSRVVCAAAGSEWLLPAGLGCPVLRADPRCLLCPRVCAAAWWAAQPSANPATPKFSATGVFPICFSAWPTKFLVLIEEKW